MWFPRFGSSFSLTSADPRIKYPSRRNTLPHTTVMAEQAQTLDINTLYNVYVIEKLIQLTIESDAKTKGLSSRIIPSLLHQCLIESMSLLHKEARVG